MEPRFREGNVRRSELGKLWVSGFRVFRGRPIPKACAGCPFQGYAGVVALLGLTPS